MDRGKALVALAFAAGGIGLVLIGVGPVVYVYFNGFANIEPSSIDGEQEWKRNAAVHIASVDERKELIQTHGLDRRYITHSFVGDLRMALYEQRDFTAVESKLATQYSRSTDPYQAYLYKWTVDELVRIRYIDNPLQMLVVLDEWVESNPTSHYAHMLRGRFRIYYGWYFRGDSHISKVSWKSREKFEFQFNVAREDLYTAHSITPGEANVFVDLLEIAYVLGEDRVEIDRLFRKAVALEPLSFQARIMRFRAGLPQWRGSWEEVDAVIAETELLLDEFPLLEIVKLRAEAQMGKRGPAYEVPKGDETQLAWAKPHLKQLERNPGDPLLMTQAAWFLTKGSDYRKAEALFREIGDNFYEAPDGRFFDVWHYNQSRGSVYAARAYERSGKPDKLERAAEAVEIAPEHYYTNYIYGSALLKAGDAEGARPYLEKAVQLDPDYLWTKLRLAQADEKLGRKEEALSQARNLLDQDLEPGIRKLAIELVERIG